MTLVRFCVLVASLTSILAASQVVAAALNGLAMLHAYFRVFTGARHTTSIDLQIRLPEQVAVLILIALIVGGGVFPQPGVASRYHAAKTLVEQRRQSLASDEWLKNK